MPVNTIQIQKLLGKHTFQQLRVTVNELINIVNGLPSTVRGDVTRQGGIIDGQSAGTLQTIDPGQFFVLNSNWVGIGDFLNTDMPTSPIGHIHVNALNSDARINLSQNNVSSDPDIPHGISYLSIQAANSVNGPANNFGFLAATSNTTTKYGMIVLSTANTDQEVSHIFARESWGWGNTVDTTSATRFTLTSGENVGLAPHGGPTAHLAAQLRVDRALANDPQTSNTAPIISARGYSGAWGGLGINDTPVRLVIGDRNIDTALRANTYAALDFMGHGADTTDLSEIGARISAEYTRVTATSTALEFAVRDARGNLEKVMKIIGGSDATGDIDKPVIVIGNTAYLDSMTARDSATGGTQLYSANAMHAQLTIQQYSQGGFNNAGLLIRGEDRAGSGAAGNPVLRIENPSAAEPAGSDGKRSNKWAHTINSGGAYKIITYPDNDYNGASNNQFTITPGGATTVFGFGNYGGEGVGGGSYNGTVLIVDGGYGSNEGAELRLGTNRTAHLVAPGVRPTTWNIDNVSSKLRIFPRNGSGFADVGGAVTKGDSQLVFDLTVATANTLIGIGTYFPAHMLHLRRNWESANVHIESDFSNSNASKARMLTTGLGNDYAVVQAINPNATYPTTTGRGLLHEHPVSITVAQTEVGTNPTGTTLRSVYSSAYNIAGNENQISLRVHSTGGAGTLADNNGWNIDAVNLIAQTGHVGLGRPHLGVPSTEVDNYSAFKINLRRGAVVENVLTVTPQGYLGVGLGGPQVTGSFLPPPKNAVVQSPGFNLDLHSYEDVAGTANTLAAFSYQRRGFTGIVQESKTWTIGVDQTFPGMGKTVDPFVIGGKLNRALSNQRGAHAGGESGRVRDGLFVAEMNIGQNWTQIYQIGVREEHNTLTVYTPANTTSPNWPTGVRAGRIGIGNTRPSHTLTVNGYSAESSGIAVYGANAAIRFIDPAPLTTEGMTWISNIQERILATGYDPGGVFSDSGPDGAGTPAERTYHIGSLRGTLSIAQNLGQNDTDIYDTGKNITVSIHANTRMDSTSTSAVASYDDRNYLGENLGEDWFSGGSVGINANSHPMAAGLFVGDVPAGDTDHREVFTNRYYPAQQNFIGTLRHSGNYPTSVIFGARPLSQANGAFKTISTVSGTTSNNSGETQVGNGHIMKRMEGLRRYSEGYIPGATTQYSPPGGAATDVEADWRTVAWHDGISVDTSYSVPAPGIGSEFMGSAASQAGGNFHLRNHTTKVWWERRPNTIDAGANYQNQEYTESHLFGSSNQHVMTIHANTAYQGVHVEKGGIYADNSILAWARILPRGLGVPDVQNLDDTGFFPSLPAAAGVSESHNILSFDHTQRGLYKLTLPLAFRNGTKYAVMVTGTNNLYVSSGVQSGDNLSAAISGNEDNGGEAPGFTPNEYRQKTFRKENPETFMGDGGLRSTGGFLNTNERPGGSQEYHVRTANSTVILIESRIGVNYRELGGPTVTGSSIRHDDDEVFVVVVGAPDKTKFRG